MQGFTLAKQHAELGRPARPDHDRGRRGQPHGAWAGDNQHRNGVDQGKGQRRVRTEDQPDQEGQCGGGHYRRYEPHGHFVDQGLDRQFRALRLLDQTDDLREHGVGADLGDAETERAGLVQRTADDFGAHPFRHRHRFAADHALVNIRGAFHDLAVDRNFLARAHEHNVIDGDLIERNLDAVAIALDPRGLGLEPDQAFDRLRGFALGPRLEGAAEQDQGDDDHGRFEIDVSRALRQHLRCEGGDHRIAIGCSGTDRDQRVHVRGTAQ
ncbi:hypothetical protein D3C77_379240 [compost metagenome]